MKQIAVVLLAVAAVALTGCIDYTEELTLNADGSGSVKMHLVMDKQFLREMEELSGEFDAEEEEEDDELCSEAEMRAYLETMNSGIELVEYVSEESDEIMEYRLEFKFSDYQDFADLKYMCGEDDEATEEAQFDFAYREMADGTWLYQRYAQPRGGGMDYDEAEETDEDAYYDDSGEMDEEHADEDEEMPEIDMEKLAEAMKNVGEAMQGMANDGTEGEDYDESAEVDFEAMMGGMAASMQRMQEDMKNHKITFIVHLPGDVSKSNATSTAGNTASWEYTLDQAGKMPNVLEAVVKP